MIKSFLTSCFHYVFLFTLLATSNIVAQNYGSFIYNVTEDSYVRGGNNGDTNYNDELELLVKSTPSNANNDRQVVLKFDLTNVSHTFGNNDTAILRLHANDSEITTINAYEVGDNWSESTITWNNLPVLGNQVATVEMGESGMYYQWDVTDYVVAQLASDKIVSIALSDPNNSANTIGFNNKELGVNIPHLAISIEDPSLSEITVSNDAEVFYWGNTPHDKNYGTSDNLSVRYDDNVSSCSDSYLEFDISSITETKETINLQLYAFEVERASEISVYGTETESAWSETTITGRSKPLATERIGIYNVYATGFVNLDVTNYVNKAINAGWDKITLIVKENEGAKISFNSKEASANPPQLMVSSNAGSYVAPVQLSGTFYFDSENGSDSNDGISEATAWKSLSNIKNKTLAAGTQLLLRSGSVWNGEEIVFKGSGTENTPIVISSYGSGDKPKLNGLGFSTGLIKLFNQEYIEISKLHITNLGAYNDYLRRGIHVVVDNVGVVNHLHFTQLTFTDINGSNGLDAEVYANSDDEKRSGAILLEVRGDDVQTYFDDVLLDQNYFYNVSNTGFANISHWSDLELNTTFDSNTVPGTSSEHYIHNFVPSKNILIKRNRFENIDSQGMIIRTAENPIMEYNLFYYCSIGRGSDNACFNSKTTDAVWKYNESCFTQYTDDTSDGAGIDSDLRSKNTLIEYNYCHNNEYGGVITTGGSFEGSFNDGTIVRYNVLINNGINSVRVCNQNTNLLVHNNLVYHNDTENENSLVFIHLSDRTTQGPLNSIVTNNIFYTESNNGTFTEDVEKTDPRFEEAIYKNNLYFGIDANYQYPNDANKVTQNPAFMNGSIPTQEIGGYVVLNAEGIPTGEINYDFLSGFHLSNSSPAIDAGSLTDITTLPSVDFANSSLSPEDTIDIGPYEVKQNLSISGVSDNTISVSPNPFSDYITITTNTDLTIDTVTIYDTTGKRIKTYNTPENTLSILDLKLSNGIYFVKIESNKGSITKKMIKI